VFACCAGLIFGSSTALALEPTLQFGGSHPLVSVLAFCAGAAATLVAAAAIIIPVMSYLFSRARTERIERIIVSALAADTAWGWLTERWSQLAKIPFGVVFRDGRRRNDSARARRPHSPRRRALVLNEWLKSSRLGHTEAVRPPRGKSAV